MSGRMAEMEDQGEGVVVSPAHEAEAVLRLRPIKTSRVMEGTIPITTYAEEKWIDEPMTPAGRLFIEPLFDCVCVCILGFKDPIDTRTFKEHVKMTIMKHKRFSSKVETRKGRPWWTEVEANVDDHVLEVELTATEKADKDIVLNYTTDIVLNKRFDVSKPLWDFHVLNAKLGKAEGCAIVRIHHALGDGTSLMSLLMACTRKTENPNMLPTLPTASDRHRSSKQLTSFFSRLYFTICRLFLIVWYSLTEIGKFVASLMWLKDAETPIKGASGCQHLPKKFRFVTINVDDLKYVSKSIGGTMNDVFVAIAAHGLRRYMDYRIQKDAFTKDKDSTEGKVDMDEKVKDDPKGLKSELNGVGRSRSAATSAKLKKLDSARVRALAMINTRPIPGLPELADMMNGAASQARWGNHMGYLLLSLPMKHYDNPLELVRETMAIGNRKKSSLEGPFTYASGSATMLLLGEKVATNLVYRSAIHTTLSMSNVKGPSEEVSFADNPITHIIPSVIGQPHALTLHLQSYNGEVSLVAMATQDIIPDPEYLLQLCVDGLQEMKKAAATSML